MRSAQNPPSFQSPLASPRKAPLRPAESSRRFPSPSTADYDRTTKRELYERYGVPECWLVDPYAKTIAVLILGADGYNVHAVYGEGDTLSSPTLAGFSLNLSELF